MHSAFVNAGLGSRNADPFRRSVICERHPSDVPLGRVVRKNSPARTSFGQVMPRMALEFVGQEGQVEQAATKGLKNFLTRRAVRTLLFYMREFHDGVTEKWLKNFENFDKAEHEINDWDLYIIKMFNARRITGTEVQEHPRGNFRREWKFEIEPSRVAMRVLDIRRHVAAELSKDLYLLDRENLEISRMHFELRMNPGGNTDSLKERILDVDVMDDSSPLRIQNYKKIRALTTHYAVHRLLQRMKEKSNHHYMWLSEYIQGQSVGPDSEQFLYTLLLAPPVYRKNPETYISPAKVATMIMNIRIAVAEEFIAVLENVHDEHMALQRSVLERRADSLFDENSDK